MHVVNKLRALRYASVEIRSMPEMQRRWYAVHEVDWTPKMFVHITTEVLAVSPDETFDLIHAAFRAVPSTNAAASIYRLYTQILRCKDTSHRTLKSLRLKEHDFLALRSVRVGFMERTCANTWALAHKERGWRDLAFKVKIPPPIVHRHIFADETTAEQVNCPVSIQKLWWKRSVPSRNSSAGKRMIYALEEESRTRGC